MPQARGPVPPYDPSQILPPETIPNPISDPNIDPDPLL